MQPSPISFPVELHAGGMVLSKEKAGRLLCNTTCSYMKVIKRKNREKFMSAQNIKNRLESRNTAGQKSY